MKIYEKNGSDNFFSLIFCHTANAADHTLFNTEKVKPGVVLGRSYRTQAEINADWYILEPSVIKAGDPGSAYYNANIDGACLPIIANTPLGNLRNTFPSTGGDVWVQYEIYLLQALYDYTFSWDGSKLFRIHTASGCSDSRLMTNYWVPWDNDQMWWEGYCGEGTVRPGYKPTGDKWTRITTRLNFVNGYIEAWATDVDFGQTIKLFKSNATYTGNERIDGAWPMLHSQTRDDHGSGDHPAFFVGYRNIIVSTQPIALTTGSATPDTTPPSAPTGLIVR